MRSGLRGCLGGKTAAMAQLGGNTGRTMRSGTMVAHRPVKSCSCAHGSLFVSQPDAVLCSHPTGCRPDRSAHLNRSDHPPRPSLCFSISMSASLIATVSGRNTHGSRNGEMGSFRRKTKEAKAKAKALFRTDSGGGTGRYLKVVSLPVGAAECSSYSAAPSIMTDPRV